MANLVHFVRSTTTSILALGVLVGLIEIAQCGSKGNKGGGSDIVLYKDNLLIRGAEGQGNLVLAGKQHHGHHHGDAGHHYHEDLHAHHGFEHYGPPQHSKEESFILAMMRDGDKGKGNKGGNKGKGKGGGGGNGGNMVVANMGNKQKSNEMNWEELILGGGRF